MPDFQFRLPLATPGLAAGGMDTARGRPVALAVAAAAAVAGLAVLAWPGGDPDAGNAGSHWLLGLLCLAVTLALLCLGRQLQHQRRTLETQARRLVHQDTQLETLTRSAALLRQAEQEAAIGNFDWDPVAGALHWSDGPFRLWGHAPGALTPDDAAFRARIQPDDPDVLARGDVPRDAQGRALRVVGTVQDTTCQHRAEARLQRPQVLADTPTDPVGVVGESGVSLLVDQARTQRTGLAAAQGVGQMPAALGQELGSAACAAALQRWRAGGQPGLVRAALDVPATGDAIFASSADAADAPPDPDAQPSSPAARSGPTSAALPTPAAAGAPLRVLYIDDNPINTLLMAAMFERLPGLVLQCECDPLAGLALALADPPALLLVDIQMPGIDGFEVLRRLRAHPATQAVPAVAVSANAMPQDLARGRAAGFVDYLTKPLELQRLQDALVAVLPGWQAPPD